MVMRSVQRKQASTIWHISGYKDKRQPSEKLEAKSCVDKLHVLRAKLINKAATVHQRAVTDLMIADPETHGTLRGAVELFSLTHIMRHGDVMFADCMCTFRTTANVVRVIVRRLAVASQHARNMEHVSVLPAAIKPYVRSDRSTASWAEALLAPIAGSTMVPLIV